MQIIFSKSKKMSAEVKNLYLSIEVSAFLYGIYDSANSLYIQNNIKCHIFNGMSKKIHIFA